ncbi:MAG: hypothetical protein ACLGIG_04130 [Actinomycetes bacterium]
MAENTLYGLSTPLDEELLSRVQQVLEDVARRRGVITYSELGSEVPGVGRRGRKMAAVLEVIGRRSFTRKGVILTVLVVNKSSGLPSEGFYWLQRDLRNGETGDPTVLARRERERVYAQYPA